MAFIIRLCEPSDEAALAAFFAGLSARTVARWHPHPLTRTFARRAARKLRPPRHVVRLVVEEESGQIAGYDFLTVLPVTHDCYRATVVGDAYQGRGLLDFIYESGLDLEEAAGIRRVWGRVVTGNEAMRGWMDRVAVWDNMGRRCLRATLMAAYHFLTAIGPVASFRFLEEIRRNVAAGRWQAGDTWMRRPGGLQCRQDQTRESRARRPQGRR